jgi:hypothetical protein
VEAYNESRRKVPMAQRWKRCKECGEPFYVERRFTLADQLVVDVPEDERRPAGGCITGHENPAIADPLGSCEVAEVASLLELPVERVLPAHGAATDRAALERALSL